MITLGWIAVGITVAACIVAVLRALRYDVIKPGPEAIMLIAAVWTVAVSGICLVFFMTLYFFLSLFGVVSLP